MKINLDECEKTLNNHLNAENSHDLEKIMETYGNDPFVNINGSIFQGVEKIRWFHARFGFGKNGAFSNVTVEEKIRRASGDSIIIEQFLSGTHTGTWQGYKATHRSFKIPVCTIYIFDSDGLLKGENVYFDSSQIISQLKIS